MAAPQSQSGYPLQPKEQITQGESTQSDCSRLHMMMIQVSCKSHMLPCESKKSDCSKLHMMIRMSGQSHMFKPLATEGSLHTAKQNAAARQGALIMRCSTFSLSGRGRGKGKGHVGGWDGLHSADRDFGVHIRIRSHWTYWRNVPGKKGLRALFR